VAPAAVVKLSKVVGPTEVMKNVSGSNCSCHWLKTRLAMKDAHSGVAQLLLLHLL
jgi:hypothetical protein